MQHDLLSSPISEPSSDAHAGEMLRFDADPEMMEIFLTESIDHTDGAEAALLRLEGDPDHMESIHTVFRAFHTLKSSSAFFGLTPISELAHWAENLLSRMRTRELRCVGPYAELALRANDLLKTLLQLTGQGIKDGGILLPAEYHSVVELLKDPDAYARQAEAPRELAKPASSTPTPASSTTARPETTEDHSFSADIYAARELLGLTGLPPDRPPTDEEIEALIAALAGAEGFSEAAASPAHTPGPSTAAASAFSTGASGSSSAATPDPKEASPLTSGWGSASDEPTHPTPTAAPVAARASTTTGTAPTPTRNGAESEPSRTSRAPARTHGVAHAGDEGAERTSENNVETFLKVRMDRLDKLVNMVGELVIAQSMVAQDTALVKDEGQSLVKKVTQLGKIVRELQNLSMTLRMVPLKATFQKLQRVARDTAQKLDKPIQFVMEGEDTELDRSMVEAIADPLMHMVRNAIDHGLEQPGGREPVGKNRQGMVRLAACHAEGSVQIQLQDDGRGLNKEKILARAQQQGLLTHERTLSEQEIFMLIFEPGFSTAEKVTDVSGRGVGMDVVRRSIQALKGRIEIASEQGKGTLFTIRLPLTLAVTDAMLLRVGGERYALPTISVLRSFRPTARQLFTAAGRGELVQVDGQVYPIVRLHQLFDLKKAERNPARAILVLTLLGERTCALLVDELLGQQQVVARSLGRALPQVPGISGGVILGDGQVGLLLDPGGLLQLHRDELVREAREIQKLAVGTA